MKIGAAQAPFSSFGSVFVVAADIGDVIKRHVAFVIVLFQQIVVQQEIQNLLPAEMTKEVLALLKDRDTARMAAVQEKFALLHHQLRRDTATLATDAIEKVIER